MSHKKDVVPTIKREPSASSVPTPVGVRPGGPGYYGQREGAMTAGQKATPHPVAQGERPGTPGYYGQREGAVAVELMATPHPVAEGERPGSPAYFGRPATSNGGHTASRGPKPVRSR